MSVFHRIDVKLNVEIVLPLIPLIRRIAETGDLTSDIRELLDLFHPDFENSGTIQLTARNAPALLRAGALLRLRLRLQDLSGITDEVLEKGLDPTHYVGAESLAVTCYLFLATLQTVMLEQNLLQPGAASSTPTFDNALARLRHLFTRDRSPPVEMPEPHKPVDGITSGDAWRVVVLNDPVNLMTYVTAVFQSVLGLAKATAEQRMREVHEEKRSNVWIGPQREAEHYASVLQLWHLTATVERANG